MSKYIRIIFPVILLGLIGLKQVHGIDGDLSNPYTDVGGPGIFDGTLDYGGKYAELPVITKVGAVFLLLGIIISGTVLIKDKKRKPFNE